MKGKPVNENMITVSGNVIAEPEMRQTKGGPMLTFRVASNHRYFNNRTGLWEEGVTNYYDVVAFRQLAVNVAESLHKGYGVFVRGQLRQRRYTRQDGSQGMSCEIAAKVVGPDLTYGVAQWMRRPRPQQAEGSGVGGSGWAGGGTAGNGQAGAAAGGSGGYGHTPGDAPPGDPEEGAWAEHPAEPSTQDLPDPERTAYVVARDDEPEERYDGLEVDEDGVILGDGHGPRAVAEEETDEPAA